MSQEMLLETSDVARSLDLSYSGVRTVVMSGKLKAAYVTPRGVKLFLPAEVEALRLSREEAKRRREAEGNEI